MFPYANSNILNTLCFLLAGSGQVPVQSRKVLYHSTDVSITETVKIVLQRHSLSLLIGQGVHLFS